MENSQLSGGLISVESPIPGKVVEIRVSNQSHVDKDDVILVIEAMKMENHIKAPRAGEVSLSVSEDQKVSQGDVLFTINGD